MISLRTGELLSPESSGLLIVLRMSISSSVKGILVALLIVTVKYGRSSLLFSLSTERGNLCF